MTWTLFLDDIRFPEQVLPSGESLNTIVICRNMDDAVWNVKQRGLPQKIYFDHDLAHEHYIIGSGEKTGYDFAKWFVDFVRQNQLKLPKDFRYVIHSMNPVGAQRIRDCMEDFFRQQHI